MFVRALSAAAALLLFSGVAGAQKYPSRTIEVIIPFAAGGGVDLIGRAVTASLSDHLGQTAVVQNRDGAGGTLGFGALAEAFGNTDPKARIQRLIRAIRRDLDELAEAVA